MRRMVYRIPSTTIRLTRACHSSLRRTARPIASNRSTQRVWSHVTPFSTVSKPDESLQHVGDLQEDAKPTQANTNDPVKASRELINRKEPFSLETWIHADELAIVMSRRGSPECVNLTWQLIDRFLKEGDDMRSSTMRSPPIWKTVEFLNDYMLSGWNGNFRNRHKHSHEVISCQAMLQKVLEYHSEFGVPVNETTFDIIANSNSMVHLLSGDDSPEFAEEVLKCYLDLCSKETDLSASPQLFNRAMIMWETSERDETLPRIIALYDQMKSMGISPNLTTYTSVVKAYRDAGGAENAQKAHDVIMELRKKGLFPSYTALSSALTAWASSGLADIMDRTDELVEVLRKDLLEGKGSKQNIGMPLAAALACYAACKSPAATNKMQELYDDLSKIEPPPFNAFNTLTQAWARLGNVQRVDSIIADMKKLQEEGLSGGPEARILSNRIQALSKSRIPKRVELAEETLKEMLQSPDSRVRPSTRAYNVFLDCIARSKNSFVASTALRILEEMKKRSDKGNTKIVPDGATYRSVINICAQFGLVEDAMKAFRLMTISFQSGNEEVKPDLMAFNTVLKAHRNNTDENAATVALQFLREMEKLYEAGALDFRPDAYSYSTVLAAFANEKHNRPKVATRAYKLLREMKEKVKDGGAEPNTVCYNAVLNAWARARNPEQTALILKEMQDEYMAGNKLVKPDHMSFNSLLKAWAYSLRKDSGEQGARVIETMHQLSDEGILDCEPSVVSYTTYILCYGLSKHPDGPARSDEILRKMKELNQAGKMEPPSYVTYKTLKRVWLGSDRPDKYERANQINEESRAAGFTTGKQRRTNSTATC